MNNLSDQLILYSSGASLSEPSGSSDKLVVALPTTDVNLDDVKDFSNVCRICATVTELVIPIFSGEGLQNNLADKIQKHLPIKVSTTDVLPQVVCYQCSSTLLAWHELVKCCVQADQALKTKVAADARLAKGGKLIAVMAVSGPGEDQKAHRSHVHAHSDSDRSDDTPLATIANKRTRHSYRNLYNALVKFRDHVVNDHIAEESDPDSSASSAAQLDERDIDSYDDLSQRNMRYYKMDDDTRGELDRAQIKINGKVFYTCSVCGKNLSSVHTYVFHKRIHTGERPCVCHVCGKQFRAPNGLQRHLTETHERLRRYACALCPKNFANSQNLKQHTRIHTGEKPYVCSQCGKRFTQSGSLHVHLKTHSEHFPHRCAECGAQFRLRSGLARHRLKHSGERPHACALCPKAFRQRHELAAHRLAHSDAKPFACAACPAAFRQRRALRHHARRLHGLAPQRPDR
ncbi:uncharacterized protein LOC142981190 isoform X3 [Anticarsia gemmatalis]|uniref:uncharacterized protein LOC142981190 isoform X3 n=1 Tax=Anticarsia gemmatalis TaxID=129554 RepID=UPI003F75ECE1